MQSMNQSKVDVGHEELVVSLTNAGANPGAVVIMDGDAAVANAAVVYSWSFDDLASWTFLTLYLIFILRFAFVLIHTSQLSFLDSIDC